MQIYHEKFSLINQLVACMKKKNGMMDNDCRDVTVGIEHGKSYFELCMRF